MTVAVVFEDRAGTLSVETVQHASHFFRGEPMSDGEVHISTCAECGERNIDRSTCTNCGLPLGGNIEVGLSFAAVACPSCGRFAMAGPCPECGALVPEAPEPNAATRARQAAYGPLLKAAEAILQSLDDLPEPHVGCTAVQYMNVTLVDAGLTDAMLSLIDEVGSVARRSFSDEKEIGGASRQALLDVIARAAAIRDIAMELCWFKSPSGLEDVRPIVVSWGKQAAELVVVLMRVLTAQSLSQAAGLSPKFQGCLAAPYGVDRMGELSDLVSASEGDEIDSRVALALGRTGSFTDDFGCLDLAKVLTAAGLDDLLKLAEASVAFLAHLFSRQPLPVTADASVLALVAVPLAVLDRPLVGHRTAHRASRLLASAMQADRTESLTVIERIGDEAPRIFASAMRLRRDVQRLASGTLSAPDEAVDMLFDIYRRLAESSLRTLAWVVFDLRTIAQHPRRQLLAEAPTVGQIEDRLKEQPDGLSALMLTALDKRVRNAASHEDYRLDPQSGEIIVRDERLTLDEVVMTLEALVAVTAGLDAGLSCCLFENELLEVLGKWRVTDAPYAVELLARASFLAFGIDDMQLAAEADFATEPTFVIPQPSEELDSYMPVLAGEAAIFPDSRRITIVDGAGNQVVAVDTEAFVQFGKQPESLKGLAIMPSFFSALINSGRDEQSSLTHIVALCVSYVTALHEPRLAQPTKDVLIGLRRHLSYVIGLAKERGGEESAELGPILGMLSACRVSSVTAQRGDSRSLQSLRQNLAELSAWSQSKGALWPVL